MHRAQRSAPSRKSFACAAGVSAGPDPVASGARRASSSDPAPTGRRCTVTGQHPGLGRAQVEVVEFRAAPPRRRPA